MSEARVQSLHCLPDHAVASIGSNDQIKTVAGAAACAVCEIQDVSLQVHLCDARLKTVLQPVQHNQTKHICVLVKCACMCIPVYAYRIEADIMASEFFLCRARAAPPHYLWGFVAALAVRCCYLLACTGITGVSSSREGCRSHPMPGPGRTQTQDRVRQYA